MQFSQRYFGSRTLRLVLVIHFDAGRNTTTVVSDTDRVVGVNGNDDVITVARQSFVNRVVNHLKNKVVQTGSVRSVANVHARPFTNSFQTFENLNGTFTVRFRCACLVGVNNGLVVGTAHFTSTGMHVG